ncbi:MAG: DUF2202 domain-containing protein [Rhodospirillales bacterium]|nr:DUF2202 domain-containing protein [Rhodospirillales bacterium]
MRQLNANPMRGPRRGRSAASSDNAGFGDHRATHVAQIRAMIAAQPRGDLTQGERDGLLLMREEEKMARDVYVRLHERWGLRPFANISGSEQAHMDMMQAMLEHFALPDPAQIFEAGQFHDAALQKLHDGLVEQGLKSLEGAVRVGLLIEELDVADLQKAKRKTKKPEILAVYEELERGSRNHLRAFYRWKEHLGIAYQASHLPQAELERIALSAHEPCT